MTLLTFIASIVGTVLSLERINQRVGRYWFNWAVFVFSVVMMFAAINTGASHENQLEPSGVLDRRELGNTGEVIR
ncbi:hypothetical protein [Roseiconus lacunae]|uniref:Uncharacterized protein n=1 Tax=Roseiconus lacunae TaxID=2605694 RepID=A0ABT7PF23_9BACT|nr:hypothetical protein [Roseiconus lacunae]MDM4014963.1 hypothetical protein [Roseiconus lacunae]